MTRIFGIAFVALAVGFPAMAAQTTYEKFVEANDGKPWDPGPAGVITDAQTAIDLAYAIVSNAFRADGIRKPEEKRWKSSMKAVLETGIWQVYQAPRQPPKGTILVGGSGCSYFFVKSDGRYLGGFCTQ